MLLKNFHIKKATFHDFEIIYDFVNQLQEKVFDIESQRKNFSTIINNPNAIYLIGYIEDKPVGFISCHNQYLMHHGGLMGEIQEMFVLPEYRSKNIGKLLLEELLKICGEMNVIQVEVTSGNKRERAHRFYLSNKFVLSHKKFTYSLINSNIKKSS